MNYAGFWRRAAASVIDSLILMIPSLVLGYLARGSFSFAMGVGLLIGFLYRPFFESSDLAGTPGKALMGVVVVTEAGDRITFKQACIRFFASYLSMLIFYIGYFMQPFTAKRQTLHDMLAETIVIRRETSEDLNYFRVWKDQFKLVMERL